MSQESLSALLDGECSPQEMTELLQALDRSPALRRTFSRLCLAREAREGTRVTAARLDFADAVMARIEGEPAAEAAAPRVVPIAARRAPRFAFQWKPVVGLAAAASLGAVAVLVAGPQARDPGGAGPGFAAPAVSSPVSLPGSTRRPQGLRTVAADPAEIQQWSEGDLDDYLIEHNNTLADRGMGGTLSYAGYNPRPAEATDAAYRPEPVAGGER